MSIFQFVRRSLFYLLLSSCYLAWGQVYFMDSGGDAESYVEASPASPLTIRVEFTAALGLTAADNVQWSYCTSANTLGTPGQLCGSGLAEVSGGTVESLGNGLSATFRDREVVISGSPNKLATSNSDVLTFRIRAEVNSSDVYQRTISLIIRQDIEIVLVLDHSGSMECDLDGDNCIRDNNSRWARMEDGVANLMNNIDVGLTVPGDRFSVVYFSGDALPNFPEPDNFGQPADASVLNPVGYEIFRSSIEADIDDSEGGDFGWTSIGDGLLRVLGDAPSDPPLFDGDGRKVILLFTDGEQNRQALIRANGGVLYIDENADLMQNSGEFTFSSSEYEIYTVSFWDTNPSSAMNHLLTLLGGDYTPTDDIVEDLASSSGRIYSLYSPNFIKRDEQALASSGIFEIEANAGIPNLIFNLYFEDPVARDFRYALFKESGDEVYRISPRRLGSLLRQDLGDYYAHFSVNLQGLGSADTLPNGELLASRGTWYLAYSEALPLSSMVRATLVDTLVKGNVPLVNSQLVKPLRLQGRVLNVLAQATAPPDLPIVIAPQDGPKVAFTATAQDHNLKFRAQVQESRVKVNGTLTPEVKFTVEREVFEDAEVQALILGPGEDLNDILARSPDPIDLDSQDVIRFGGNAALKYRNLRLENPEDLIPWRTQVGRRLELVYNDATQSYLPVQSYRNINVSGNYRIIYWLEAEHPELGTIIRTKQESKFAEFPSLQLEIAASEVIYASSDNQLNASVTVKPSYRSNGKTYFVGPGYGYAFSVADDKLRPLDIKDLGDGSYELTYEVLDGKRNPDAQIYLLDEPIHEGPLSFLSDPYRWGLSVHAGYTLPQGAMDSTFNGGFYVEGDLSFKLTPAWMLELLGGSYGFDSTTVLGGALLAKYNLVRDTENWDIWLGAGPGLYVPQNETLGLGARLQASASRCMSNRLSAGVELGYLYRSNGYQFLTTGLGVKLHF